MSRGEILSLIPVLLLCQGGYTWGLTVFFERHLGDFRFGRKGKSAFVGLLFAWLIAVETIIDLWYIPWLLAAAVSHMMLIALVMLFFRAEAERKLFGSVLAIAVNVLVGNFSGSVLSCLVLLAKKFFSFGETACISVWGSFVLGALAEGIAVLAICVLAHFLTEIFVNRLKRWYMLMAIPLIFIVGVVDVVNFGASRGIMVVAGAGAADYWNEYDNMIFSHIGICIVTALSMCAAGIYVYGMNRVYLEQQGKEQYRAQVAFYRMLEEQYGQMERLRHDMKNHLTGLTALWQNREWEKMGDYLARMREAGDLGQEEVTGSRVIDALLYRKRRQAEAEKISWECDVRITRDCPVDEFDLCVLMGNLVDNALEGCRRIADTDGYVDVDRDRYIRICSGMVKKCLLLEVENSAASGAVSPEILARAGKGRYSTREKSGEHGIGLMNVREAVDKYDGIMNVEMRNGAFVVSVLLPMG